MTTLSWNCQGIGPPWKVRFLKDVISQERPNFVFLCETICKKEKMEFLRVKLGFEGMVVVEPQGRSGGLAFLWREKEQVNLLGLSQHHIDVGVSVEGLGEWRITGIFDRYWSSRYGFNRPPIYMGEGKG
ncbi:hypothetical protein POM88_008180 [Heracleum sosnowskyi]|uniref:Endonuclease/exonuclease/phosphatase domain-containing protein n=1 Tax=Heracleum sosnowskyi TaxID=360622 RepID=A0AAD8J5X1_9APIA|nr:hypothetical protein POM88_008180 [Heracleum sosnowskyi]